MKRYTEAEAIGMILYRIISRQQQIEAEIKALYEELGELQYTKLKTQA